MDVYCQAQRDVARPSPATPSSLLNSWLDYRVVFWTICHRKRATCHSSVLEPFLWVACVRYRTHFTGKFWPVSCSTCQITELFLCHLSDAGPLFVCQTSCAEHTSATCHSQISFSLHKFPWMSLKLDWVAPLMQTLSHKTPLMSNM